MNINNLNYKNQNRNELKISLKPAIFRSKNRIFATCKSLWQKIE